LQFPLVLSLFVSVRLSFSFVLLFFLFPFSTAFFFPLIVLPRYYWSPTPRFERQSCRKFVHACFFSRCLDFPSGGPSLFLLAMRLCLFDRDFYFPSSIAFVVVSAFRWLSLLRSLPLPFLSFPFLFSFSLSVSSFFILPFLPSVF